MELLDIMKLRRSNYELTTSSTLQRNQLTKQLAAILEYSPSAFNSQSSRIVVLYDAQHLSFWDLVLRGIEKEIGNTPAFEKSQAKIAGMKRSAGTILFFEDEKINIEYKNKFPLYASNIDVWKEHSQGMLQLSVWTMLAEAGMGASLQHYSELVAPMIQTQLGLDSSWRLIAQMPFGIPNGIPTPKAKVPGIERIRIFE